MNRRSHHRPAPREFWRALALLTSGLSVACSQSTSPGGAPSGTGGQGDSAATGGATSDNTGGSESMGTGGGAEPHDQERDFPDVKFEFDPSLDTPPATCAAQRFSASPLPLDMYVILDRTGSMRTGASSIDMSDCDVQLNSAPSSNSKWCLAVHALGRYFTSDAAEGNRAALQFMQPGSSVEDSACGSGAANPHSQAAVELSPLPEAVDTPAGLISALNAAVPDAGNTEIESALHGISDYTWANRTATRKMIGVLVTDGAAAGNCSIDTQSLAQIASDHFETSGIPTFIIGMTGAPFGPLEEIAVHAGGPAHESFCDPEDPNQSCHYWSVGDGDPTAFVEALAEIQESAVGCTFSIPETEEGLIDLETVSVDFKANSEAGVTSLARVFDEIACTENGFYTVQDRGRSVIKLCSAVCDQVGDESEIGVEVQCSGE